MLKKHLKLPEATVITGMRRTGKTMILKYLFEELASRNKIFLDLESRVNREIFEIDDYEEIWTNFKAKYNLSNEKTYIFLDEIQNLSSLPSIIKYLFDHYQVKFVVTGSSSFYLKNLFSESLSGRKQIFELFTLTFDEFLVFKNKLEKPPEMPFDLTRIKKSDWWQKTNALLFDEYLRFGAFPQVVLENNLERKTILLKDILYSYIETDVKNLSSFRKISEMEKLIRLLSGRVGQKLDIAKISREISISRATIMEYLGFLEKTYFIFLIKPFSKSLDRQLSKAPKIYFCDMGLAHLLSLVATGQALENAVYHAFRVKHQPRFAFSEINYYQRRSGAEIDFILDEEIGVEVKETAESYDYKKLADFARKAKLKKYFLISKNLTSFPKVVYASQL